MGLDENLHTTAETENQVQSGLLLDIVVGKSATVLQLLTGEDETLLVWRNTFLVLNLSLDVFNSVRGLDFKSDGLSGKSLDEDLHTTTKTEDQVKSRLLLNVVVRKSAAILELLASEDQTLLIWGNALLVLDLSFYVLDGIRSFDLKSNGLASEGLDKDLHTTTEAKDQMKS